VFYRPLDKINAVIETYPKGIAGFRAIRSCWRPSRISRRAGCAIAVTP
jgi:hypothetical protein